MGCGLPGGSAWLLGKDIKAEKGALSKLPNQHTLRACPSLPRVGGLKRATPAESQGALWSYSGDKVLVSPHPTGTLGEGLVVGLRAGA